MIKSITGGRTATNLNRPAALPMRKINEQTWERLVALADEAPINSIQLSEAVLRRAITLGYSKISQIRHTPPEALRVDFGESGEKEIIQALSESGLL